MLTNPLPYQASLLVVFSHTLVIHPHTSLSSKCHLHYLFLGFIISQTPLQLPNSSVEFFIGHLLTDFIYSNSKFSLSLLTNRSHHQSKYYHLHLFLNSTINQNGMFTVHSQTSSAKLSNLDALTACHLLCTYIHH